MSLFFPYTLLVCFMCCFYNTLLQLTDLNKTTQRKFNEKIKKIFPPVMKQIVQTFITAYASSTVYDLSCQAARERLKH